MKTLASVAAVLTLLLGASAAAVAASSSQKAREDRVTAELNQAQIAAAPPENQAPAPAIGAAPMNAPQAPQPTVIGGKVIPPGASCGAENPSCAGQVANPAANSVTQFRLLGAP